jgi:hypothetical protein
MKTVAFCICLVMFTTICLAESNLEKRDSKEPTLFDHYRALRSMQESLAARSPEDQIRLRPQIQRAERQACDRLRQERLDRVPKEEYRRQGGDEFLVFAQQFEQYCQTLQ